MLGAGRCRICPVPTAARPLCRPSPHTPLCRSRKDAAMRARQRGTHQPARTFAAARRRWTVGGGDPSWHIGLIDSAVEPGLSAFLRPGVGSRGRSSFLLPRQDTPPFCSPVSSLLPSAPLSPSFVLSSSPPFCHCLSATLCLPAVPSLLTAASTFHPLRSFVCPSLPPSFFSSLPSSLLSLPPPFARPQAL